MIPHYDTFAFAFIALRGFTSMTWPGVRSALGWAIGFCNLWAPIVGRHDRAVAVAFVGNDDCVLDPNIDAVAISTWVPDVELPVGRPDLTEPPTNWHPTHEYSDLFEGSDDPRLIYVVVVDRWPDGVHGSDAHLGDGELEIELLLNEDPKPVGRLQLYRGRNRDAPNSRTVALRTPWIRLVADDVDAAALGEDEGGDQLVKVQVGDQLTARYYPRDCSGKYIDQSIGVGRPAREDSNDRGGFKTFDIRPLALRILVFALRGEATLVEAIGADQLPTASDGSFGGTILLRAADDIVDLVTPTAGIEWVPVITVGSPRTPGFTVLRYFGVRRRGPHVQLTGVQWVSGPRELGEGAPVQYSAQTPVISRANLDTHIRNVRARFAQATIALDPRDVAIEDLMGQGVPLPAAILNSGETKVPALDPPDHLFGKPPMLTTLTDEVRGLLPYRGVLRSGVVRSQADHGRVDVFYVPNLTSENPKARRPRGRSFIQRRREVHDKNRDHRLENFAVVDGGRATSLTLAHEILHVLRNAGHADDTYDVTHLLRQNPVVNGPTPWRGSRRIGPYGWSEGPMIRRLEHDDVWVVRENIKRINPTIASGAPSILEEDAR